MRSFLHAVSSIIQDKDEIFYLNYSSFVTTTVMNRIWNVSLPVIEWNLYIKERVGHLRLLGIIDISLLLPVASKTSVVFRSRPFHY